jgi:hypothetical protein
MKPMLKLKIRHCVAGAAIVAGPLSLSPLSASDVPDAIAARGEILVATVQAAGVQIYECKAEAGGKLAWQFREPVATLFIDGKTVGRHYAGPHWEMTDGSVVSAKVSARASGASGSDIPLLKLDVTSWRGVGQLAGVTTIQRINTRGGIAEGACEVMGDMLSVPYAADYTFFRKAAAQTVSQPSARGPAPAYVASPAVVLPRPAIGVIVVRGDDRDWPRKKKKPDGQPKGPKGPVSEPTTPPPATPPTPPTAEPKMPPEKATPGKATPNTGTPGPVVRDHRTPKPAAEVRDHRAKPKVRDHRESATASNGKTGGNVPAAGNPSGSKPGPKPLCGFAGLPPCK